MSCRGQAGARLAALLLLILAACREPSAPAGSAPGPHPPCSRSAGATTLALAGGAAQRPLPPGAVHAYPIAAAAGEYVDVAADQHGVDLTLALLDAGGERLLTVDGLTGDAGIERLDWWSASAAQYRLLVCAADPPEPGREPAGSYRLRLARRPATPDDRDSAAAARAFSSARQIDSRSGTGALEATIAGYRQALELWRKTGDARAGEALFLLAWTYDNRLDEPETVLDLYRRALPYFEDPIAVEVKADALHGIGRARYQLGELDAARDAYQRALALYRAAGYARGAAVTSNNLGMVYELLGEIPEALAAFERALSAWRELGDRHQEATTLHNRGMAYLALGDGDRALDDLERALAIRRKLADPRREAATLTAIGLVHLMGGELERALAVHEGSLALRRASGDRHGMALSLNNLGITAVRLDQPDRALDYYRRALPILEEFGDRRHQALLRHNLGHVLVARDPDRALDHFRRALPVFEELGDRRRRAWTLSNMAAAERRRGRLQAARKLIEEALTEIERLRTRPANQALRASFFANQQWAYDVYVDLLMELHRRAPGARHDLDALTASERARARSQLDVLADPGAADPGAGLAAEIDGRGRLAALEGSIRTLEEQRRRLLQESAAEARLRAVEGRLRELVDRYERRWGELRGAGGETPEAPLTAAEIRDRVADPETLVLEYDLGPERSYLWAITREEIVSFELPAAAEIEELTRRAYRLLTASHGRKWRGQTARVLTRLGELLLGPVAGRLDRPRLAVAGEGVLDYLPWSALPMPGGGGDLVADHHEVVTIPSASTLDSLRRNLAGRTPPPGALAVFADPVFDAGDPRLGGLAPGGAAEPGQRYGRLQHSRQEAEAILALLGPGDPRLAAFDFEASRELAAGGELGRYRLLHFATHGEIDATQPQLSRLVFSRFGSDGRPRPAFLFAHEIYRLDLPAELVVLSACRTALGKEVRGEGLVGLAQSFFFAGAARVLVSLWNVDDRVTAELMSAFYRHLLVDGRRPPAALRAAQLEIRRQPRWQARYYWAGFVLKGEWR